MLTTQNRQAIYDLLTATFKKDTDIDITDIGNFLQKQGMDCGELGYTGIEDLLCDLKEFVTIHESEGQKYAVLTEVRKTEPGEEPIKNRKSPAPRKKQTVKKENPVKKKAPVKNEEEKLGDDVLRILYTADKDYTTGKEYPLAAVSKTLYDNKFDISEHHFTKMKTMLSSYPDCFKIRPELQNGVEQPMISFLKERSEILPEPGTKPKAATPKKKPVKKAKEEEAKPAVSPAKKQNENKPSPKSVRKSTQGTSKTEASEPENKVEEALHDFYIPDKIVFSLKDKSGLGTDDATIEAQVREDCRTSIEKKTYEIRDGVFYFPLSFRNKQDKQLSGCIKKADSSAGYEHFLSWIGPEVTTPKNAIREVYFENLEEDIKTLASLAKEEKWCYKGSKDKYIILKTYLTYTYFKLQNEDKILVDEDSHFAAFNTGLVSPNYEPIYGVMMINDMPDRKEKYIFQGFSIAGMQGLGKTLVEHFSPLPKRAEYAVDKNDLYLDARAELHPDYNHIINDNLERFPMEFLKTVTFSYPEAKKLVLLIEKEKDDFKRSRYCYQLSETIAANSLLHNLILASLKSAIDLGLKMVNYDPRMILPSYFPSRNVISLMLPLTFDSTIEHISNVLLIEKTPAGNYQGQTILTLKQCYTNARLIGPLDNTFLDPDSIQD